MLPCHPHSTVGTGSRAKPYKILGSVVQLVRMLPCHPHSTVGTGSRAKPYKILGSVVQLVRMLPCHGRGRGFESRPVRKQKPIISDGFFFMSLCKTWGEITGRLNVLSKFLCVVQWYVYIIQSEVDGQYYKGMSAQPFQRVNEHNKGTTVSTRSFRPWTLVYVEQCESKSQALMREKNLKKADRARIEALFLNHKNIVAQFIRP